MAVLGEEAVGEGEKEVDEGECGQMRRLGIRSTVPVWKGTWRCKMRIWAKIHMVVEGLLCNWSIPPIKYSGQPLGRAREEKAKKRWQ